MLAQLVRFAGVGGLATALHVVVAILVEAALPVSAQGANLAGFCAAVLLSYLGHARFTFRVAAQSGPQFLRFVLLSLVGLGASSLTVWIMTEVLEAGFVAAMAAVTMIVPTVTYVSMRLWVFSHPANHRILSWTGSALPAAITIAMAVLFWDRPLTNDVAWYLIATRDWLGGAALYDVIIEVNPPLNFYFTVPAILTADLFQLSDTQGQYVFIWLIYFACLGWCSAILRARSGLSAFYQAIVLVGISVAVIVPSLDSIGQREYHLVVLMMPWLLSQLWPRSDLARTEIAAAAVAALGVCLKPHFLLFPLAITLERCVRCRSLRPILSTANLTFFAVGTGYVGYVAIVHPTYLVDIVPIAGLVYGAYSADVQTLLAVPFRENPFLLLPALIALVDREGRMIPPVFGTLCLAGLLSFLMQGKGFSYHLIPFLTFGLMGCFLLFLSSKRLGPFVVSVAVAAVGLLGMSISGGFHRNYTVDQVVQAGDVLGDFKSIMVLSPHVFAGPPVAFETGSEWVSRYPANWLVPGALNRLSHTNCATEPDMCERLEQIAARNRSENIADMIAKKPDLLIVDRDSKYFEEPQFDWLGFMAEDPAWAGVFGHYQEVGSSTRYIFFLRNQ